MVGLQCQQYTFGQTNQTSASSEEQEFKSAFDTFVYTDPGGYGNYEEKKSNVFKPGETFWLYLEPTGFSYGNVTDDGNRLYTINFTAGFHISKNGEILSGQENLPLIDFASHRQNKEISLDFSIDQTEPFPPGDYVITYTVTDENSGKSFDVRKDVTVHE